MINKVIQTKKKNLNKPRLWFALLHFVSMHLSLMSKCISFNPWLFSSWEFIISRNKSSHFPRRDIFWCLHLSSTQRPCIDTSTHASHLDSILDFASVVSDDEGGLHDSRELDVAVSFMLTLELVQQGLVGSLRETEGTSGCKWKIWNNNWNDLNFLLLCF